MKPENRTPKPRSDGRYAKTKRVNGQKIFGYGRTEAEALEDLEDKLSTLSTPEPEPEPTEDETVHEFAKRVWYPSLEFIDPISKKRYTSNYRTHVRPRLGEIRIRDLKKPVVQEMVYQMLRDKVGGPTIRYTLERVSSIASLAIDHELISSNPTVKLMHVPKKTPKREKALSLEQALTVLDGVEGTDLSAPVLLALFLGLRRGEIAGLKWEHLDRQRGELKIVSQRIAEKGEGVKEKEPKGRKTRVLRLTRELIRQIDARGNLDSEYICTRLGEPWVPQTIYDDWLLVRGKFGLEAWTVHDLRHGAAGLLFATGSDFLEVAQVLGHGKPNVPGVPSMTWNYTSLSEEGQRKGFERLSSRVDKWSDNRFSEGAGSQSVKARLGEGGPG